MGSIHPAAEQRGQFRDLVVAVVPDLALHEKLFARVPSLGPIEPQARAQSLVMMSVASANALRLPISWKGTLIQYTGRIHRLHPAKRQVRMYDYVDVQVPVLTRMFAKRLRGCRLLGYAQGEAPLGFGEIDDDFVLGRDWAETVIGDDEMA